MGNKASKLQTGRVLQKHAKASPAFQTRTQAAKEPPKEDLAGRLQKLGPVAEIQDTRQYQPASSDAFTATLEARQKLEQEHEELLENPPQLRSTVPAQTITEVLRMLKERPKEQVAEAFQIEAAVFELLETAKLPKVKSETLQTQPQQRQPVRRKRKT